MPDTESRRLVHSLPLELLYEVSDIWTIDTVVSYECRPGAVFACATEASPSTGAKICMVCKEACNWMLPLLYKTVTLTSSDNIVSFAYTLMGPGPRDDLQLHMHPAATCIRHLWLGPTSSNAEHDLSYTSIAWPITLIHQILARCTALRALAIVNLPQTSLFRLGGVIPGSVEALALGPIHGHIHSNWPVATNLRALTSMDTFLADWDVAAAVQLPRLRTFARLFTRPAHIAFAFDQLPCVRKAARLAHARIVCCDERADAARRVLDELAEAHAEVCTDARVELVARSNLVAGVPDGIGVLYRDWVDGGFGLAQDGD